MFYNDNNNSHLLHTPATHNSAPPKGRLEDNECASRNLIAGRLNK